MALFPGQVAGDVVEGDRLRRGRDPAWRHHDRQPLDEAEDRLEGGAPLADDHGCAQSRHRDARSGEPLSGLASAAQVRRRVGTVGAERRKLVTLRSSRATSSHMFATT